MSFTCFSLYVSHPCLHVDQIYGSSVNSPVRHKCLSVIGKLMFFSSAEMIQSLLGVTNVSRYPLFISIQLVEMLT